MKSLLQRHWAVVTAGACIAALLVGVGLRIDHNSRPATSVPRELADFSPVELAQFLPNAADLPNGWRAQQDGTHPGIFEVLGRAAPPTCSQRPDQDATRTALVSAGARARDTAGSGRYSQIGMALVRDGATTANLQERIRQWVNNCGNVTMYYGGTGMCQADLHAQVLPDLEVGAVRATRIKIVSTNFHCLRGGAESDSTQIVSVAALAGLTLITHSDDLSTLGEPLTVLTLQRLQNHANPPAPAPDALGAAGPAFMALAPTLAQTRGNGRWFVDQWTGAPDRETVYPMTTEPVQCEPLPFPGGYDPAADRAQFATIGGIHVLRYSADPKDTGLKGDVQAQYFREPPEGDVLAAARAWAKRCQQYRIVSGHPCQSQPTVTVQVRMLTADTYGADDAIRLGLQTSNWCSSVTARPAVVTLLRVRGVLLVTKTSRQSSAADWLLSTAIKNLQKA
ncbi:hypothetical protein [Mycobacteroides franklinii]|uniref:Uncharacterized protein n=1 Tax=Mycobacteroides franklinii TaxID=948102 RepID=A0A4R8RFE8_9MYCO|nr:hypothetical protein [Mycobacteroides franklinii]TDZ42801.1 hypothetical protein CCUG64054_02850 [Mycobacteroides franklinii]TDZ52949.1 hypothetical protein CCUG63697_01435 [Mycobacteroides franklinii]TDZ56356.1 hypothetical protein CCUG63696_02852 [Mycobacteroides franklinii]TDZ63297.1 hypothetical protein CCUG63695_02777 [Mycobacteroides franklinii]TDZ69694.1 hypothetical protein CCUG64056_02850 [Mycobacteroides franklinii]